MNPNIEAVTKVAVAAGRIIQEVRREGFDVEHKGADDPVTRADRAADQLLHDELLTLLPCGWLSEETADSPERLEQRRIWVVDPLDGTKEFIAGIPEYAVAVALVEDGEACLAVVHNPATGETFWAERGGGAFRGTSGQTSVRIRVVEGDLLFASRSELKYGEFAPFVDSWAVKPCGSIAYKLARIAAGDAAATFSRGPKWEWDVCAGSFLIQEAGGHASELLGSKLLFNKPFPKVKGILAGAEGACGRALAQIETLPPSERMEKEFPAASE
jgi:myo-inositol-1(or 4)-monophosphatase